MQARRPQLGDHTKYLTRDSETCCAVREFTDGKNFATLERRVKSGAAGLTTQVSAVIPRRARVLPLAHATLILF
jgi:hypothetical protein